MDPRNDREFLNEIRSSLLAKRRELFESHGEREEELDEIAEDHDENELVEIAQEEQLTRLLDRLDEHDVRELEEVQRALGKIAGGGYGICERCHRTIAERRLRALPATPHCLACSREVERMRATSEPADAKLPHGSSADPPVVPDVQNLSDDELREDVTARLAEQEGFEGVEVSCRQGTVILTGEIPSEDHRDIATQLIVDGMGVPFEDRLRTSRMTVESVAPSVLRKPTPKEDDYVEVGAQGIENLTDDVHEGEEEGLSYTPPDRPVPPPRKA